MRIESDHEKWQRLTELLTPFHGRACATARRLSRSIPEGDDLFHDAVLRAFEKLPTLRDESRFRPWFYAVLLSVHRTRSRSHFWRRFLALEEELTLGNEPAGEDGAVREEERERAARASRALATLPSVQREAVVLFEMEGYSVDEVAAMQEVSVSAVKSRLARGRGRLRRHYERLGFTSETPVRSIADAATQRARGGNRLMARQVAFAPATATERVHKEACNE
ncbi:MAG: RNA polymerase sigma factor [bacterium]